MERIRLGISSCLLGESVRYDGGHKLDRVLIDMLGQYVEFIGVCPEVECGLGIPREPVRLEGDPQAPRLVTTLTRRDLTDHISTWSRRRVRELESENLSGFIFKSNSPSSGLVQVPVFDKNGIPQGWGVGIFARIFVEHFPLLPVEDEARLRDPVRRESFIKRVFGLGKYLKLFL
jgi:uncharacterized protein YbbK (DUF523 family)